MKNIEFKARCESPDIVRDALADMSVPLQQRIRQLDTYFNVPQGRLKLREVDGGLAQLIQYLRSDEAKARESDYLLVAAPEPAKLKTALEQSLGIQSVVDKMRELYLLEHTRVHLDQVKGLGVFVELETVISDQSVEQAQDECERIRLNLGIQESAMEPMSYSDLIQG